MIKLSTNTPTTGTKVVMKTRLLSFTFLESDIDNFASRELLDEFEKEALVFFIAEFEARSRVGT